MWRLTVRSPDSEPKEIDLKPGVNTIGRLASNDVVIQDSAASRRHAEITYDSATDVAMIRDLDSTNGTHVNRQHITTATRLQPTDLIRIGQVTINLTRLGTGGSASQRTISGTHPLNREMLLDAVDQHAILLYEVSRRLNTVVDTTAAQKEVAMLIKRYMAVDGCEVVLERDFDQLLALGIPHTLALQAIQQRSAEVSTDLEIEAPDMPTGGGQVRAAMCAPAMCGDDVLALIYMYRVGLNTKPFDQRDLQLAVGISHQTALTIQRMNLLEKVHKEQQMQQLFRRFVGPQEADFLLQDYLKSGQLPGLSEHRITILFSDIEDSTSLAERLGTQHFATILNNFYQDAADIIFRYNGMLRYLGDGVMAIFVSTKARPSPEIDAVRAGQEIIARGRTTGRLDPENRVIIGVSVNTGKAMMGYVGTQDRAEFTVIGDTVNVAFRMQEYARPYRIVVGPATMAAIVGQLQTQRIGEVSLKGREKPVQIYEVFPL